MRMTRFHVGIVVLMLALGLNAKASRAELYDPPVNIGTLACPAGSTGYGNARGSLQTVPAREHAPLPFVSQSADPARLERMLRQADIIVTARDGTRLVGVSRAISDFAYCCYLSDLAVDVAYQRQGIGKRLIDETRKTAGEGATLILVAAPAAETYYPKIGMTPIASGWMIPRAR